MAKATIVKITSINENGVEVITNDGKSFVVNLHSKGVLTITAPMGSMTIFEFAKIIVGCFETNSTFSNVSLVTFTFNTVTINVTLGEALDNPNYVVSKWEKAFSER